MNAMSKRLCIFLFFLSLNLNAQIEGVFKHTTCEHGPDCFIYSFSKNGVFTYSFHYDILGSGILTGKYIKIKDKLKLTTDRFIFNKESKILEEDYFQKDSTKIAVKIQRASEKDKNDIQLWEWYISINNGEFVKTNSDGVLVLPKIKVEKMEIKDSFAIEIPELSSIKLVQSIFYLKTDKNSFEIYLAEDGEELNSQITNYAEKSLLLKGDKLFIENSKADKDFYKKQ